MKNHGKGTIRSIMEPVSRRSRVGSAPGNYHSSPEIQSNLRLLDDYLGREYAAQSTINRVVLLWASAKLLVGAWKRADGTALVTDSDGYATGLITFAPLQAGVSRDNVHVEQGLSWLVRNQSAWGVIGRPIL